MNFLIIFLLALFGCRNKGEVLIMNNPKENLADAPLRSEAKNTEDPTDEQMEKVNSMIKRFKVYNLKNLYHPIKFKPYSEDNPLNWENISKNVTYVHDEFKEEISICSRVRVVIKEKSNFEHITPCANFIKGVPSFYSLIISAGTSVLFDSLGPTKSIIFNCKDNKFEGKTDKPLMLSDSGGRDNLNEIDVELLEYDFVSKAKECSSGKFRIYGNNKNLDGKITHQYKDYFSEIDFLAENYNYSKLRDIISK